MMQKMEQHLEREHAAYIQEKPDENYVFVYGTLMKGMRNHNVFLRGKQFVGNGEVSGFDMYNLGTYPGIIRGSGSVEGEVYCVSDKDVRRMDQLESVGFLYEREVVTVEMADGRSRDAFVYIYLRSVEGRKKLGKRYSV